MIGTGGSCSQSNRDRAELVALVALRRLGMVEDCAKIVGFLATDLSDYVTGGSRYMACEFDSQTGIRTEAPQKSTL